ncbi:hypothetical protein ABUL17_08595 [Enterobacter hormaechei]|uniref:hypothetical protein n=1 Tax=Enterobacter cloacae complex TaxID=354276 RepID=UPI000F830BDA|nr:hypothetical protein [Enterobacter hormaechei]RTN66279.1 hypothetical protein EKN88_19260 [Enterobacter hormaechei]HCA7801214.1 hypothetical protein [Enterobacter hormaechei]HDW0968794.1 hypothetical protein [Enterobacter hormaechei subsp. xiangfangensis]
MRKRYHVEFEYDDNPHEFIALVDIDDGDSEPVILGKILAEVTKEADRIYGLGGRGAFRSLKVYEEISE